MPAAGRQDVGGDGRRQVDVGGRRGQQAVPGRVDGADRDQAAPGVRSADRRRVPVELLRASPRVPDRRRVLPVREEPVPLGADSSSCTPAADVVLLQMLSGSVPAISDGASVTVNPAVVRDAVIRSTSSSSRPPIAVTGTPRGPGVPVEGQAPVDRTDEGQGLRFVEIRAGDVQVAVAAALQAGELVVGHVRPGGRDLAGDLPAAALDAAAVDRDRRPRRPRRSHSRTRVVDALRLGRRQLGIVRVQISHESSSCTEYWESDPRWSSTPAPTWRCPHPSVTLRSKRSPTSPTMSVTVTTSPPTTTSNGKSSGCTRLDTHGCPAVAVTVTGRTVSVDVTPAASSEPLVSIRPPVQAPDLAYLPRSGRGAVHRQRPLVQAEALGVPVHVLVDQPRGQPRRRVADLYPVPDVHAEDGVDQVRAAQPHRDRRVAGLVPGAQVHPPLGDPFRLVVGGQAQRHRLVVDPHPVRRRQHRQRPRLGDRPPRRPAAPRHGDVVAGAADRPRSAPAAAAPPRAPCSRGPGAPAGCTETPGPGRRDQDARPARTGSPRRCPPPPGPAS